MVVRYRSKGWSVESTRFYGPNAVICDVVPGGKWTPLIITDLLPSTMEHLQNLKESLTLFRDQDPILLGYLNANIGQYQNLGSHKAEDLMTGFGVVDLLHHFRKI